MYSPPRSSNHLLIPLHIILRHNIGREFLLNAGPTGGWVDLVHAVGIGKELVLVACKEAIDAMGDDLGHGAALHRHNGRATSQRLNDCHTKGLIPLDGKEQCLGISHKVELLLATEVTCIGDAPMLENGREDVVAIVAELFVASVVGEWVGELKEQLTVAADPRHGARHAEALLVLSSIGYSSSLAFVLSEAGEGDVVILLVRDEGEGVAVDSVVHSW